MRVTMLIVFFFQAEDGIRDDLVTGVQTCALPSRAGCVRWSHRNRHTTRPKRSPSSEEAVGPRTTNGRRPAPGPGQVRTGADQRGRSPDPVLARRGHGHCYLVSEPRSGTFTPL